MLHCSSNNVPLNYFSSLDQFTLQGIEAVGAEHLAVLEELEKATSSLLFLLLCELEEEEFGALPSSRLLHRVVIFLAILLSAISFLTAVQKEEFGEAQEFLPL